MARLEISHTPGVGSERDPVVTEIEQEKWGHTVPDAIMKAIRPMRPSRTSESCVYSYDSPDHGAGKIVVTISGWLDRERMDEKVHMLEIERALGRSEPGKISDTAGWMYSIRLQVRNPYIQILFGAIVAAPGIQIMYSALHRESLGVGPEVVMVVLAGVAILVGFFGLVLRGVGRVLWWHRARAEVKRRGDTMPFDLKVLG